ncbi:hypothetical protein IV102_08050 [bacterium]|nr:hypothetical protein [bacterium]
MATTKSGRGFSLLEAVLALSITSLLVGSLGFLLIYASRTLKQAVSYNTVQQQSLLAMRKIADDLTLSNIYSIYSVANPPIPNEYYINPVGGVNATFLSPKLSALDVNRDLLDFDGTPNLLYRSWVGFYVDADKNLIRAELLAGVDTAYPIVPLPAGVPPLPWIGSIPAPALFTGMTGAKSRIICRGIATQDPLGAPVVDSFQIETDPSTAAVATAANISIKVQDKFGSGNNQFHQLNFFSRVFVKNTTR